MSRRAFKTCFNYYSQFDTNKLALDCSRYLSCLVSLPRHSFVPCIQRHRHCASLSGATTTSAELTYRRNTHLPKTMVKRKRSLRLADSDSENRRTTRLSQVQKIPGFKAAVESYGGDSKEGVSVALLDAFLDAHLKGRCI